MTSRWVWFAGIFVIIGTAIGLTLFAFSPPVPQPTCDPQRLIVDQQQHIADLAQWLHSREVVVMVALAVMVFSVLYLQLAHAWSRESANIAMIAVVAVVSGATAWAFWTRASLWTRIQRDSCLGEALLSVQAVDLSFTGRVLNPGSWLWGITVDAFVLGLFGTFLGWAGYRIARSAVRL